jgi:hypothetical protein
MHNFKSYIGTTFFVSREPVRAPAALELVNHVNRVSEKLPGLAGSASVRFAKGFLVTVEGAYNSFKNDDVIEIADYDPVRYTILAIGIREPSFYTPLHWITYKTQPGSNAVLTVLVDNVPENVPAIETQFLSGSLQEAMEAGKALKDAGGPALHIGKKVLLLHGRDIQAVIEELTNIFRNIGWKEGSSK